MFDWKNLILDALAEDIGRDDVTTSAIFLSPAPGKALLIAKEELVLAGIEVVKKVFSAVNQEVVVKSNFLDGEKVEEKKVIAEITGNISDLLKGERVALNFLQHLSGIATLTRKYVERVADYSVKIVDTRKTTPGLRILEKYAVQVGGGRNHRFGLFDGVLIKENHIKACGSIADAVKRVRIRVPHTLKIEVEVGSIGEVKEALASKVDIIMLDNMPLGKMEESVKLISHRALVEASGNITLNTVYEVAKTGVDLISSGSITHSAPASDISMIIKE